MTNHELMRAWLEDSADRLAEAQGLIEKERYHRVVRLSQERSELAFKPLLAFCGLDVPKEHHLSKLTSQLPLVRQLPPEMQSRLYQSSHNLAKEHIPFFHGAPDGTPPPNALYDQTQAEEALEQAGFILDTVKTLIKTAGGRIQVKAP